MSKTSSSGTSSASSAGGISLTIVLVTIAIAAFMQLVSGVTDAAVGLNPLMSVPEGAAPWPTSNSQGSVTLADLVEMLKRGTNGDNSAATTQGTFGAAKIKDAPSPPSSTDAPPAWLAQVSVQCGARLGAAAASAAALVPFMLIAILTYYAVVKQGTAQYKTNLPVAALWTTAFAAVFSIVANFAVTAGALTDAANTGSFTPIAFEAPTSIGVSATNLTLSLAAVCVTIAALVKQ